jgi:hypothetical protein
VTQLLSELPQEEPVVFFFDRFLSRYVDEDSVVVLNSGNCNTRWSSLEIDGHVLSWSSPCLFEKVFGGEGAFVEEVNLDVVVLTIPESSFEVDLLSLPSSLQVDRSYWCSKHNFLDLDLLLLVDPPQPVRSDADVESPRDISTSLLD